MSVGPFFVRIRGQLGFVRRSLGITHVGTFKIKYAPTNAKITSRNQAASNLARMSNNRGVWWT